MGSSRIPPNAHCWNLRPAHIFFGGVSVGLFLSVLFNPILRLSSNCNPEVHFSHPTEDGSVMEDLAAENLTGTSRLLASTDGGEMLRRAALAASASVGEEAKVGSSGPKEQQPECKERADFLPRKVLANDPWHHLKSTLRPARCKVKGFPIEELDPENNFRRFYSLGFTESKESRLGILSYMRPTKDLEMSSRRRRVYIDLGSKWFESSLLWILRHYPLDFSEIHVFEARPNVFRFPAFLSDEEEKKVLLPKMTNDSRWRKKGQGPAPVPRGHLSKIRYHEKFVSTVDDPTNNRINITRVMKQKLGLKKGQTVVVKMDIEGAEWDVLKEWLKDPEMHEIVDELFVEVHYSHPSMDAFGWNWHHTREEATNLLADLRARGFYAHMWP